uniref:Uncharacterized protein n=1 Tax=Strongyloides papillosus TaxID=174720 RepID=A0A0N5BNK6_STREA
MVLPKVINAVKYTAETLKGAAVTLANPNAPIEQSKVIAHRMPARPFTMGERLRMFSWRHCWKYVPVLRFYVFSGIILYGVVKYVLPIKPRNVIQYHDAYEGIHHHEVEQWKGAIQNRQDALYFQKYNPLKKEGEIDVSGHH